jgi:hypothetical protein
VRYFEKYDLEREIGWQMARAVADALKDPPEISRTEDLQVEVIIRVRSETFPGKSEGGRSRSSILGQASCLYRGWSREEMADLAAAEDSIGS